MQDSEERASGSEVHTNGKLTVSANNMNAFHNSVLRTEVDFPRPISIGV